MYLAGFIEDLDLFYNLSIFLIVVLDSGQNVLIDVEGRFCDESNVENEKDGIV